MPENLIQPTLWCCKIVSFTLTNCTDVPGAQGLMWDLAGVITLRSDGAVQCKENNYLGISHIPVCFVSSSRFLCTCCDQLTCAATLTFVALTN